MRADVDVRLIGLALPERALKDFLLATAPREPTEGFAPEGESGYFTIGKRHDPLEPGGRVLGFEPLSVEFEDCLVAQSEIGLAVTAGEEVDDVLAARVVDEIDAGPGLNLHWFFVCAPNSRIDLFTFA